MQTTQELIDLLTLETDNNTDFIGRNNYIGSRTVYGGQVVAQALSAAYQTVPKERFCHSLHSYFLLPGDLKKDILYQVTNLRDGGSFTTRSVIAKQDNQIIFMMAASFQLKQDGYHHQIEMPKVRLPEELISWEDIKNKFGNFLPNRLYTFLATERPLEFKPVEFDNPLKRENQSNNWNVWVKFKHPEKEYCLPILHQLLAYASDYNILSTALRPHAEKAHFGNTQMASIDHSIWFFRVPDISDWILFSMDTPNASGARGFTRGNVFNRNGDLIASITQEGLIRPKT